MTQKPLKNTSTKHSIVIQKTATYYTLGNVKTAKTIWFVLHGYGYLAEFFIKKFEPIANTENCIIAPEALSKFYLHGFSGRIGASWMTKHLRTEEIVDYTNFLEQLYENTINENKNKDLKINIVGFSQGGATACRWFASKKFNCTNFILWANFFPEDLDFEVLPKETNLYLIYGTKDEFLNPEHINSVTKNLEKTTLSFKIITFDGTHDIPKKVLLEETAKNGWN